MDVEDYDGWIIVGTGLDDEGIDKDLRKLKTKLRNEEDKLELKIAAKEDAEQDLKRIIANVNKLTEENEKNKRVLEEANNEYKKLEQLSNTKGLTTAQGFRYARLDNELASLKDNYAKSNAELEVQNKLLDNIENKVRKTNFEYGEQVRKVLGLQQELRDVENNGKGIGKIFSGIGEKTTAVIKKVGRWALAVFGIRSAYLAIRQAMSTLTQYDETLKADLQYIRFAVATALKPIIEVIINLAYKLLGIINLISIKLFNYNLFANATVDKFREMNNQANKLRKTLAGFDEMNIIGDTGSGIDLTPRMDLSQATKDVDNWLTKLKKKFNKVSVKIFSALFDKNTMNGVLGEWDLFGQGIGKVLLGIEETFDGLFKQVKGIFRVIKGIFTADISEISGGLTQFLDGLGETLFKGLPTLFSGLADTLLGIIKGLWTGAYNFLNWAFIDPAKKALAPFVDWIDKNFIQKVKGAFNKLPDWAKKLIKGIINQIIATMNFLIDRVNEMLLPFRLVITAFGKIMGKDWNLQTISIPKMPYLAKGAIINQPGRGVPVGGAMAGESGREGVLPLTDSQQMALLGAEIGKNVVVNLTNILQMNGRQLNRELKTLQAEDNFAFNR